MDRLTYLYRKVAQIEQLIWNCENNDKKIQQYKRMLDKTLMEIRKLEG